MYPQSRHLKRRDAFTAPDFAFPDRAAGFFAAALAGTRFTDFATGFALVLTVFFPADFTFFA
jgi:hypothetical protein